MADIQNNEPDIEDREANIRLTVQHIISTKLDEMYEQFDRLHRRNISDQDVVAALRYFGDIELLDGYAEWADIDIREDDNTTLDPTVPDPMDSDTNRLIAESHKIGVVKALIIEQLKVEREREMYFDPEYDGEDVMVDGPLYLTDLSRTIVKGLGK
jgi:hypothetical protein